MGVHYAMSLRRTVRMAFAMIAACSLAACASSSATSKRIEYRPAPGSYFSVPVRQGDTVSEIADRYQVHQDDILALNNVRDRNFLRAGSAIRVPAYGHLSDPRLSTRNSQPLRNRAVESRPVGKPQTQRTQVARNVPKPKPKPAAFGQRSPRAAPTQPVQRETSWLGDIFSSSETRQTTQRQSFIWPVRGPVISPFGETAGGARNDGINISAPRGTPVRAAGAGTVTYVGNELKGYGNLVLIRHDNGYVTAYAHADTVTVARGDRVTRGQIIAYSGATGDVTRPQLHFELRLNTKPVDPTPFLVTTS